MSMFLDSAMILLAGLFAGVINTMAGGGSLLTLPVLIFMGLPSSVANGTNRIAIFVQCVTAAGNFNRKGYLDKKLALIFGIPAIIGSFIGANLAIQLSDRWFNVILAVIMVFAVTFIVWNPGKKPSRDTAETLSLVKKGIGAIVFFFIGIYGGFIQAGAGFFILMFLTGLFGFSLVKSNALKNTISGLYIFFSLFIFIYHGEINWIYGIVLAVGNASGAWIGSSLAIKKGDRLIKGFLVVAVIGMAIKLVFF